MVCVLNYMEKQDVDSPRRPGFQPPAVVSCSCPKQVIFNKTNIQKVSPSLIENCSSKRVNKSNFANFQQNKMLRSVNAYAPGGSFVKKCVKFTEPGRTNRRTDRRTNGRSNRYMPPASVDAGGIKKAITHAICDLAGYRTWPRYYAYKYIHKVS